MFHTNQMFCGCLKIGVCLPMVEAAIQTQVLHKVLIWFEHAAHSPIYEEPNRFHTVMVEKVLKQTK